MRTGYQPLLWRALQKGASLTGTERCEWGCCPYNQLQRPGIFPLPERPDTLEQVTELRADFGAGGGEESGIVYPHKKSAVGVSQTDKIFLNLGLQECEEIIKTARLPRHRNIRLRILHYRWLRRRIRRPGGKRNGGGLTWRQTRQPLKSSIGCAVEREGKNRYPRPSIRASRKGRSTGAPRCAKACAVLSRRANAGTIHARKRHIVPEGFCIDCPLLD